MESSDGTTDYEVDCIIGIFSCPEGNTGKLCKHQVACAEYSLMQLPQQYNGSPASKMLLMTVAKGGDQGLTSEFFRKHHDEKSLESSIIQEAHAEKEEAAVGEPASRHLEESCPRLTPEDRKTLWDECFEKFKFQTINSPQLDDAFLKFHKRAMKRETESATISFLKSAGQYSGTTRGRKSLIRVQPDSVRRRKGLKKGGHGPMMHGGIRKRRHNLSANVSANVLNAKQH